MLTIRAKIALNAVLCMILFIFSLIMESWLLRNVGFYRSFLPFYVLTQKIGRENDPSKKKMGLTVHSRSLNPGKAIAMAICPTICLFYYLASAHVWRGVWIFVRSKDAQKQLARTSLRVKSNEFQSLTVLK